MPKDRIIQLIDFFYPPFRSLLPLQTFRYAVCGGSNTLLGLFIYTVSYKYVLRERILDLGFYAFKPHIAALFIAFCINFPIGFLLMKFVVFHDSTVKGRVQLFRYFVIFVVSLFINYWLLKLLVEVLHVYAVAAQIITTAIIVLFSYIMQRHYSFKRPQ
jgi:putative flippase GtrA